MSPISDNNVAPNRLRTTVIVSQIMKNHVLLVNPGYSKLHAARRRHITPMFACFATDNQEPNQPLCFFQPQFDTAPSLVRKLETTSCAAR